MFAPYYLVNELRRRVGRTIMTALGLAAGVGLVMGIVGVSNGLGIAQNKLLSPLSTVGTDIIITRTVGASTTPTTTASPSATASPSPQVGAGPGGGGFFQTGGPGGKGNAALNASDQAALLSTDSSVLTDLAKLGPAGSSFTYDFFVPGTLITFPSAAISDVAKIKGVASAVGELSLQGIHETGTVPKITATFTTGSQTLTVTSKPPAPTAAQETCIRNAFASKIASATPGSGPPTGGGGGKPRNGGGGFVSGFGGGAILSILQTCDPAEAAYQENVVVPSRTISQIVNPPSTNTQTKSYTVAGVNPAMPNLGVITKAQVTAGSWFTSTPAHQVLVNTAYASTNSLKVGSSIAIDGTTFTVIGLVSPTLTGDVSDLYFDLPTLQTMSTQASRVNEVLVTVDSASQVNTVAKKIQAQLPGAQVLTAKSLDESVTGSLGAAHTLADTLGMALAIIVLAASFFIAILLTLSSVAKRVKEIGSLRAMGWTRGQVVRQIVAETLSISLIGAVMGVALGFAISAVISAAGPTLQATVSGLQVGASTLGSVLNSTAATTQAPAVQYVHLTAPVSGSIILLGVGAALIGGLVAGGIGGWRASRLAPAIALRDLG